MTDSFVNVLVPYSRFVECQDRRHRIVVELTRRDQPPTDDVDVPPVPAETASPQPLTANTAELRVQLPHSPNC